MLCTTFLAAVSLMAPRLQAQEDWGSFNASIVNGGITSDFPAVGVLLFGDSARNASVACTGTLIGCETFVTAAHCVCNGRGSDCQGWRAPSPSNYFVYLQHAGLFGVSSIAIREDFYFPVSDVAVLKLTTPVSGIRPVRINTIADPPAGMPGTITGFGRSGGGQYDYGILRTGQVRTDTCTHDVSGLTSVCWVYGSPVGPPGTNSNTCHGDSGGPLFLDFGGGPLLAGITSGGETNDCLPTDYSFDANVFYYRTWIEDRGGIDLMNMRCGNIPQVGDRDTEVNSRSGSLRAGASIPLTFDVRPGTKLLRITLNAINDLDLYVKALAPATLQDWDCRQDGSGNFAACEFANPAAGSWSALVRAYSGGGAFQVTATQFGLDCSQPENDGQACDDKNACTADDRCRSGICAGLNVPDDTACDDGNLCTNPDTCMAGQCRGGQHPRAACHAPFRPTAGFLRIRSPAGKPPSLNWRWAKGTSTDKSEFGRPVFDTPLAFCIYDQEAGSDTLVFNAQITAGEQCGSRPCWATTKHGFRYLHRSSETGISRIELREGVDGAARINLRAHGPRLTNPPLPLKQDPKVVVQLNNGSACWEARYGKARRNGATDFFASPGP